MYNRFLQHLACTAAAACSLLPAAAVEWLTNVEQAQQLAQRQHKAVLVNFTGTDWCVYCRKLHAEVLDKPAFDTYAKDKFVCVEMDLPHKPLISKAQLEYNRGIVKRYGVTGYPTLLVLNAKGELVGGFIGFLDLQDTLAQLDIALQNAQDLPRLKELQGAERVRALNNLYKTFRQLEKLGSANDYRKLLLAEDKDDVTGIQAETRGYRLLEEYRTRMRAAGSEAEVMQIIEQGLAECRVPEVRVELLNRKVQLMQPHVETVEDLMAMKEVMLESARQIPEHAKAMEDSVEATFRDPEGLLELIKSQRR